MPSIIVLSYWVTHHTRLFFYCLPIAMFKKFITANFSSKINIHPVNMSDNSKKKSVKILKQLQAMGLSMS